MKQQCLKLAGFPVLLVVLMTGCRSDPVGVPETVLTLAGGAVGQELELMVAGVRRFEAENPGVRVRVVPTPNTTTERLRSYQTALQTNPESLDVLQVDVVWSGLLAEYSVDLRQYIPRAELEQHFAPMMANNLVEGKLVSLPLFADVPLLYYRTDLLERYGFKSAPATWDELERMARTIQAGERKAGAEDFWGYVWQGRAYEGLTCNALEWQLSHGGGNFLQPDGRVTLNTPESRRAFRRASGWVGNLSPLTVITFDEEEGRGVWQAGRAAFMRNWTYAYSLSAETELLAGRFGVARMPDGGAGSASTLGGWQLMVSRHSQHPSAAASLVQFLCGESEQKWRAIEGSMLPTITTLYRDEEILEAVPIFKDFDRAILGAVARPAPAAGQHYNEVSRIYWTAVHDILLGSDPEQTLSKAESAISTLLH